MAKTGHNLNYELQYFLANRKVLHIDGKFQNIFSYPSWKSNSRADNKSCQ